MSFAARGRSRDCHEGECFLTNGAVMTAWSRRRALAPMWCADYRYKMKLTDPSEPSSWASIMTRRSRIRKLSAMHTSR